MIAPTPATYVHRIRLAAAVAGRGMRVGTRTVVIVADVALSSVARNEEA